MPLVQEHQKTLDQAARTQNEIDIQSLKDFSRNKVRYQRYLVRLIKRFIKDENLSNRFTYGIESNDLGIAVSIENTNLVTAFQVVGEPKYDIFACRATALKVANTVALLSGAVRESDGGIPLATKKELQIILNQK